MRGLTLENRYTLVSRYSDQDRFAEIISKWRDRTFISVTFRISASVNTSVFHNCFVRVD